MRLMLLCLPVLLCFFKPIEGQSQSKPFPQHVTYTKGSIKPNHISQKQLDELTFSFYEQWKNRYVKAACAPGQYYIWFERPGVKQCVSEGKGYGMTITALMAGANPAAKATFDGLFDFYKNHRNEQGLM